MEGIAGVGYKEDGRIVFNAPRALKSIRELPPKAYHLVDFDAYERVCGRRWAMYAWMPRCEPSTKMDGGSGWWATGRNTKR
jgi:hypothetical protein